MQYLDKVGSTYYFRRVIPDDVLGYFLTDKGTVRREWKPSLRTKDRRKALELCSQKFLETEALIREARAKLAAGIKPDRPAPPIPVPTLDQPWDPFPTREDFERHEEQMRLDAEWEHEFENDPVRQRIANAVEAALKDREEEQALLREQRRAEQAAAQQSAPKATRLAVLVDQYAAERKPNAKRIDAMVSVATWFEKHVGRMAVEAITPEHVLTFKDKLLAVTSEANAQTKLRNFNTLLRYAKDTRRIIRENPAEGISVTVKAKPGDARREFNPAELAALLGSPVYATDQRPDAGAGDAAYWLPLLGLYTGARLNELGQLRPGDIAQETYIDAQDQDQQAWVIRITANADEGLKLKNIGSERRVPIHADLIALGFLKFVESTKGQTRIFNDLRPDKYGHITANWSKWFNRYLRTVAGVTDTRVVFHSFRHSFKHYARQAHIPKDVHDAITGHASSDAGDDYGGHSYPLDPLVKAIGRYRVPGLKLPPPPPAFR